MLQQTQLVECDPGSFLRHIHILVECAIGGMLLLLDGRAELEERLGYGLVRSFEHINEPRYKSQ